MSQTIQAFRFRVAARLNAGATVDQAVDGALREGGPLRAVRVSSAQARGAAKRYAYWGAVRYVIALTADGSSYTSRAIGRATSDRRSVAGAARDAEGLASSEGRLDGPIPIGRVSAEWIASVAGVL